jgi:hypothetical protein
MTQYTLATATGPAFVGLLVHVSAGLAGIGTGYVALAAAKGGNTHRSVGRVFVYVMLVMALFGAIIAAFEGKIGSVNAGVITAYFVLTALLAVRPMTPVARRFLIGGMFVALGTAALDFTVGTATLRAGHMVKDGVPVPAILIFGTIALLSAMGDWRVIRRGSLTGTPRLVRHLWRMCFSLFIAAGSFFIGQAHLIPAAYRNYWLLAIPAFAPVVALLYWLWRVKLRRSLRGIQLVTTMEAA